MNRLCQTPSCEGFQFSCVTKGLIYAFLLTIILCIFVSVLLQYTPLSEGLMPNFASFIFFISMLTGAVIGARSAGCKGLFHGLSVTLIYLAIIFVIGLISNPDTFTFLHIIKRVGYALVSGVLGGFIGIGLAAK